MANIINLNTAQPEELTTLPGIGPSMAERIIAARPYEIIDDLRVVSGVGPALIERLTPLVTVSEPVSQDDVIYLDAETEILPQELEPDQDMIKPETEAAESILKEDEASFTKEDEPEIPDDGPENVQQKAEKEDIPTDHLPPEEISSEETTSEDVSEEDIIPKEKAIIAVKEKEKQHEVKKPKPVTWGRALLVMTAFSLISFLLAVLLTLGIIGTLNNGLQYVTPSKFQELSSQASSLETQIEILLEDVEGIRSRLDNLEGVPAQISELENTAEQLNADMAITVEIVEGMNAQIEDLQDSSSDFQNFLDGLAELMNTLRTQSLDSPPQEAP